MVVGGLVALYGALGLGQALQNAMNIAWSVPRNSRPNPILLRLKSLFLLLTAGVAVLTISVLSTLAANTEVLGEIVSSLPSGRSRCSPWSSTRWCSRLLFRVGAARSHNIWRGVASRAPSPRRCSGSGCRRSGTVYVTNVLGETSAMNQTFALVLGLDRPASAWPR